MEYREYQPHSLLANYIECYWTAYADKPPFQAQESLIPDGSIELMFNFGDNYAQIINNKKETVKGSHVIGIRKRSLFISQTNRQNIFSIRFKLGGMFPFFKIPIHLFANGFFGIRELFGKELDELEEKLSEASSDQRKVRIAEQYLMHKLRHNQDDYEFTSVCLKIMLQNPVSRIHNLAKEVGTNYKTIERKFNKVIGLTPSEFLKIKRFNDAVISIYTLKHNSLTAVAYDCGYYDQSHFIREFKQLTAFTPKEFLKEQFTIVQVIQPSLAERMSKLYNL